MFIIYRQVHGEFGRWMRGRKNILSASLIIVFFSHPGVKNKGFVLERLVSTKVAHSFTFMLQGIAIDFFFNNQPDALIN